MSSSLPKVLLLVNSDPQGGGIGEIFLRDLVRSYPRGQLVRFSTVPGRVLPYEGVWFGHAVYTEPVAMSALPVVSSYREWQFNSRVRSHLIGRARQIIREHNIDLIWCVANSPSVISFVQALIEDTHLPLVTTIWDTPEYFILNQWLDPFTAHQLYQRFTHILNKSLRISVTGESMRKVFLEQYGVEGITCLHGVDPKLVHESSRRREIGSPFVIAFAGSLYAKREWNALLSAIASAGGKIAGRKALVRFIGRFPRTFTHDAPFVDHVGILSPDDTIAALATADVAYLPYWFIPRRRYIVKTAFPSKLSTYVAAGLPVLYHGPFDSSPTSFLSQYPLGIACHSLGRKAIAEALYQLATDEALLKKTATARKTVLAGVLSQEAMLTSFAKLLGVQRRQLFPSQPDELAIDS